MPGRAIVFAVSLLVVLGAAAAGTYRWREAQRRVREEEEAHAREELAHAFFAWSDCAVGELRTTRRRHTAATMPHTAAERAQEAYEITHDQIVLALIDRTSPLPSQHDAAWPSRCAGPADHAAGGPALLEAWRGARDALGQITDASDDPQRLWDAATAIDAARAIAERELTPEGPAFALVAPPMWTGADPHEDEESEPEEDPSPTPSAALVARVHGAAPELGCALPAGDGFVITHDGVREVAVGHDADWTMFPVAADLPVLQCATDALVLLASAVDEAGLHVRRSRCNAAGCVEDAGTLEGIPVDAHVVVLEVGSVIGIAWQRGRGPLRVAFASVRALDTAQARGVDLSHLGAPLLESARVRDGMMELDSEAAGMIVVPVVPEVHEPDVFFDDDD